MSAVRRRLQTSNAVEPLLAAAAASLATLMLAVFGERRLGLTGLLLPLVLVLAITLLRRPVAAVATAAGLAILCEGRTFGLPVMPRLYDDAFQGLTLLDGLIALAIVAVALDLIRTRRPLRMPAALALPLLLVVLAMTAGVVVTRADGGGLLNTLTTLHVVGYLVVLPAAIVNLDLDRRQLRLLLGGAFALAIVKAIMGLLVMSAGLSVELGGATITYYEPTSNWLMLVALLGIVAALVGGMRPPPWMLLGTPLLIASLVLSYRRSFWIAAVLGLLLVVLLGTSARGWRVLAPAALLVGLAIWIGGSNVQTQTPLARRVESLSPSQIQRNAEDRYRLDERANVVAEIKRHPISGIGLEADWRATERSLPVEHEDGRRYVHFALLWWWLKLGILGVAAFVSVLGASALLAWRTWRRNATPLFRCFGLASLCGYAGLVAAETTASFTGIDARFTLVFAVQLGLLAVLASPPLRER